MYILDPKWMWSLVSSSQTYHVSWHFKCYYKIFYFRHKHITHMEFLRIHLLLCWTAYIYTSLTANKLIAISMAMNIVRRVSSLLCLTQNSWQSSLLDILINKIELWVLWPESMGLSFNQSVYFCQLIVRTHINTYVYINNILRRKNAYVNW